MNEMARHITAPQWLPAITRILSLVALLAYATSVTPQNIRIGPQVKPVSPIDDEIDIGFLRERMNIPELRLAIPVLDPNIPISADEQRKAGIWPELRKAESVRSALKIKEWVHRYNQFESIVVAGDASISADLYLIGSILESDGETMRIRYQLIDATNRTWLNPRVAKHRVELGWHQRNEDTGRDPFDPLYEEIALDVYEALKDRAKKHVAQLERNERASASSARLSELQLVTYTRDLAFAEFIAPHSYGDSLAIEKDLYKIQYIPSETSDEWTRIRSVQEREDDFVVLVNEYYTDFLATIEEDYTQWQRDAYPIAREIRLERRASRVKAVTGAALLIASAAAAVDGAAADGDGSAELATSLGAAAGAGLLVSSFVDNNQSKIAVAEINELGKSIHTAIKPTRVALSGKIVTLRGSVHDQFTQFRNMLKSMYDNYEYDPESVVFVASEAE